jgi:hypothetical protein
LEKLEIRVDFQFKRLDTVRKAEIILNDSEKLAWLIPLYSLGVEEVPIFKFNIVTHTEIEEFVREKWKECVEKHGLSAGNK